MTINQALLESSLRMTCVLSAAACSPTAIAAYVAPKAVASSTTFGA